MTPASIVVPVLNGAATISDTLRAVQTQAPPPGGLEVIVVDNGSTDETLEIVRRFPVTLLHCTIPGASACRNVGLAAARGEILLNLDADTLPTRSWLREMLRLFDDPAVHLVGGRTLSFQPETGPERYIQQAGLFDPQNNIHNPEIPFVIGCNLAVRRDTARAVDGWDESLLRGEDIDFSIRVTRHQPSPIHYSDNALLFHRNRRTDHELASQARGYGYGMALIYQRYPELARWNLPNRLEAMRRIIGRSVHPELLRIGYHFGCISAEELEFARYHRLWTHAFWHGFFSGNLG